MDELIPETTARAPGSPPPPPSLEGAALARAAHCGVGTGRRLGPLPVPAKQLWVVAQEGHGSRGLTALFDSIMPLGGCAAARPIKSDGRGVRPPPRDPSRCRPMAVEVEAHRDSLVAVRRVLDDADEAVLAVAFVQQRGEICWSVR
jgi:hypothetical protein